MDEQTLRTTAVNAARWACRADGSGVVNTADDRYRYVVQGRQDYYDRARVLYSSCGDLGHFVRWAAGIRARVNRADELVPHARPDKTLSGWRWLQAENVSWLVRPANAHARQMGLDDLAQPGDVLVVDDGVDDQARKDHRKTHVIVVLEDKGATIRTAEYGQPGGAIRERIVAERMGRRWLGERRVISWLPLWAEYQADAGRALPAELPELGVSGRSAPPPEPAPTFPAVERVRAPYVTGRAMEAIQRRLQAEGLDVGTIDGVAGVKTTQALVAWAMRELSR
jgi:hypothetical protein